MELYLQNAKGKKVTKLTTLILVKMSFKNKVEIKSEICRQTKVQSTSQQQVCTNGCSAAEGKLSHLEARR